VSAFREIIEAIKGLLTWWITVAPWEQAIRARLGKHLALLGPGAHLRIPIADRIYLQSIRRRITTVSGQILVTSDGKPLTISVQVGYQIADLVRLYQTLHHAEGTIASTVQGAVGAFVVGHRSSECAPEELAQSVAEAVNLGRYGLSDVTISVVNFAFVRTYRIITGDAQPWMQGGALNTEHAVQPGPPE
jgi:regulator of protease activity HflC (stomatin/prohibitin superfamily)